MIEEWRPVPGYPGYEVSSMGGVRSARSGRLLRGYVRVVGPCRHRKVELSDNGKQTKAFVHRLVLAAFRGAPSSGQVARHLNGDSTDNRLENLAWGSCADNGRDTIIHGRGAHQKLSYKDAQDIRRKYASGGHTHRSLAAEYGVRHSAIGNILRSESYA